MSELTTPLHEWHLRCGGKMIEFAGYALPVFYRDGGLLQEHLHTRTHASIFDVSHMGQLAFGASDGVLNALARLMPADLRTIKEGMSKYTVLMNETGGVIDDCIVSNDGERGFFIVINASRKAVDIPHLRAAVGADALQELTERALVAVQGPHAAAAVQTIFPAAAELKFMHNVWADMGSGLGGGECRVSRCGYTGEDGFEISVPASAAMTLVDALMKDEAVKPAGLGARDSLRLEAGLCLYGNELDEQTSPIEAGLTWSIPKARRESDAGYHSAELVAQQVAEGAPRRLIGLLPASKAPVRGGAVLSHNGREVGRVTSGVHSPSLGVPIALAYVEAAVAGEEEFAAEVRGKQIACKQTAVPFVAHRYFK